MTYFFSQKNTDEQNTQGVRKIAAPPPTPPPKGRGVITEIPLWAGCRLLFASLLVSSLAVTLCDLCMPKAFCELELCAKMLSELCALCERKTSPASFANVLFLTEYTEEQNTQHSTETLSQPISQNVTATFSSNAL